MKSDLFCHTLTCNLQHSEGRGRRVKGKEGRDIHSRSTTHCFWMQKLLVPLLHVFDLCVSALTY